MRRLSAEAMSRLLMLALCLHAVGAFSPTIPATELEAPNAELNHSMAVDNSTEAWMIHGQDGEASMEDETPREESSDGDVSEAQQPTGCLPACGSNKVPAAASPSVRHPPLK